MELENHGLATIVVIIASDKNHQWMLKPVDESGGTEYLHSFKVSPHKVLITENKIVTFKWRELLGIILTKSSKLSSPVMVQMPPCVS